MKVGERVEAELSEKTTEGTSNLKQGKAWRGEATRQDKACNVNVNCNVRAGNKTKLQRRSVIVFGVDDGGGWQSVEEDNWKKKR